MYQASYPEMMSNTSDLATLTQVLHMEAHTQGTRDSVQKHIPVSSSATDNDLVLGRLLRLAVIQVRGGAFYQVFFLLKILRENILGPKIEKGVERVGGLGVSDGPTTAGGCC